MATILPSLANGNCGKDKTYTKTSRVQKRPALLFVRLNSTALTDLEGGAKERVYSLRRSCTMRHRGTTQEPRNDLASAVSKLVITTASLIISPDCSIIGERGQIAQLSLSCATTTYTGTPSSLRKSAKAPLRSASRFKSGAGCQISPC